MRTGIILAAGLGSRLIQHGKELLKPMMPILGTALILRNLRGLARAGCQQAVIVTGYGAEQLEHFITSTYEGPLHIRFARNAEYTKQNGVSLLCAKPYVDAAFVLLMADHVFGDEIMDLLAKQPDPEQGAILLVDSKLHEIFDMDDATKVLREGKNIIQIGKQLATYNCIDTGAFLCSPDLFSALEQVHIQQNDASLSQGIQALTAKGHMHTLDIGAGFWQDVDTPEMLAHTERQLALREGSANGPHPTHEA